MFIILLIYLTYSFIHWICTFFILITTKLYNTEGSQNKTYENIHILFNFEI